jgi:hypothetical protein
MSGGLEGGRRGKRVADFILCMSGLEGGRRGKEVVDQCGPNIAPASIL